MLPFEAAGQRHEQSGARKKHQGRLPVSGGALGLLSVYAASRLPALLAAAAATAAAAAEATAAATAARPTTAAADTLRTRTRHVHVQRPAVHLAAVEGRDGVLALLIIVHLDERKTTRTPSVPIRHDADAAHRAECLERRPQVGFRRLERQVSNKNILQMISFKQRAI